MFARKWHCFSDDYEAVAHPITIEIAHGHLVRVSLTSTRNRRGETGRFWTGKWRGSSEAGVLISPNSPPRFLCASVPPWCKFGILLPLIAGHTRAAASLPHNLFSSFFCFVLLFLWNYSPDSVIMIDVRIGSAHEKEGDGSFLYAPSRTWENSFRLIPVRHDAPHREFTTRSVMPHDVLPGFE